MQYIDAAKRRATLYQIRKFILYGGEAKLHPPKSYAKQCEQIYDKIEELLQKEITDPDAVDQILSEINSYTSFEQEHALLLGMRFGASLLYELLCDTGNHT